MALAAALQQRKQGLRKTEAPPEAAVGARSAEFLGFLKDEEELQKVRRTTGIHTEQQRVEYFLNSGVDAWYDEMKENLAKRSSGVTDIDEVTFPTSVVDFSRPEKVALFDLFKATFGDGLKCALGELEAGVAKVRGLLEDDSPQEGLPTFDWQPLIARLDEAVKRQGGSAFVKLSTRSPKDSFAALLRARQKWEDAVPSKQRMADAGLDQNDLWVQFSERLRLGLCAHTGKEALVLLATSLRVWEDLESDITATDHGQPGSQSEGLQIIVRAFDKAVTPATEYRGFVWGGEFTCCAQYFHQLHFPGIEESREEVAADLQRFYAEVVKPSIPVYIKERCPCFMMDLVWKRGPDGRGSARLTEINPFDGEAVGTFPASTGLYLWEREADRRQIMGEAGGFELRLRPEPLITAENLRSHPALRNLSPLWVCGIYGGE